jgi:hypothetical protein
LAWLKEEGFLKIVTNAWTSISKGSSPVERWQCKIRQLSQFLRGWARNESGIYKRGIFLDRKAKIVPLNNEKLSNLCEADHTIAKLKPEEESKWVQWAKVKQVHEGVDSTKYFNLIANNKHSRKKIF